MANKFFKKMKDGGAESTVTGYFLVEIKWLITIVLLKFEGKSREAFHEHAFNCINWLLRGALKESFLNGHQYPNYYNPSLLPFKVTRSDYHKVSSRTPVSWVLSIRGPWHKTWKEYLPKEGRERTLTHGRLEIA